MFGLFKKKGEQPEEEQRVQNPENKQFKAFAAKFLPEELTILAVTGANGFGGGKTRGRPCGRPPSASPPGWRRTAPTSTGGVCSVHHRG